MRETEFGLVAVSKASSIAPACAFDGHQRLGRGTGRALGGEEGYLLIGEASPDEDRVPRGLADTKLCNVQKGLHTYFVRLLGAASVAET